MVDALGAAGDAQTSRQSVVEAQAVGHARPLLEEGGADAVVLGRAQARREPVEQLEGEGGVAGFVGGDGLGAGAELGIWCRTRLDEMEPHTEGLGGAASGGV